MELQTYLGRYIAVAITNLSLPPKFITAKLVCVFAFYLYLSGLTKMTNKKDR
jgi:hypothetical protein